MRLSMTAGKASGALVACLASFACLSGTALGAESPVPAPELPASAAASKPIPTVNDASALVAPSGVIDEAGVSELVPAPLADPIQAIEQTPRKLESDAQAAVDSAATPAATTLSTLTLLAPVTPVASQPRLASPTGAVNASVDGARKVASGGRSTTTQSAQAAGPEGSSFLTVAADVTGMSIPVVAALASPAALVAGAWMVSDAPGGLASSGGSMVAAAASSVVGSGLDKLAWSSQDAAGLLGLMVLVGGFVLAYRSRMIVRYVECPG